MSSVDSSRVAKPSSRRGDVRPVQQRCGRRPTRCGRRRPGAGTSDGGARAVLMATLSAPRTAGTSWCGREERAPGRPGTAGVVHPSAGAAAAPSESRRTPPRPAAIAPNGAADPSAGDDLGPANVGGSVAHPRSVYSGSRRATSSGDGMRAISSVIARPASRWPACPPCGNSLRVCSATASALNSSGRRHSPAPAAIPHGIMNTKISRTRTSSWHLRMPGRIHRARTAHLPRTRPVAERLRRPGALAPGRGRCEVAAVPDHTDRIRTHRELLDSDAAT
jgi:hypothetical protein